MPDLQYIDMRVNFAVDMFHTVAELCTEIGIRHPEELSLMKPFDVGTGKKRKKSTKPSKSGGSGSDETASQGSMGNGTLGKTPGTPGSPSSDRSTGRSGGSDFSFGGNDTLNPYSTALSPMLTHSPATVTQEQLDNMGRGKPMVERAIINTGYVFLLNHNVCHVCVYCIVFVIKVPGPF